MKSKKTLFIIITIFTLILAVACALYPILSDNVEPSSFDNSEKTQGKDNSGEGQKVAAPDFKVYDKEGNPVYLSDYSGKPVIVNFWASWCGPCKMEMPDFDDKYRALGNDIQFMMINMTDGYRETVDTASAFIEKEGYDFPVFYDLDSSAANTYGAYSLPMTFFINADGFIVAQATGAIDGETLQKGIDMM